MRSHHWTSICLVSSLYFLLKINKKMGKKTTQKNKKKEKKTQHKTDDGFCFFDFFFSNCKKMGCPQHRGLLSLGVSCCPQPLAFHGLPRRGATCARRRGRDPADADAGWEGNISASRVPRSRRGCLSCSGNGLTVWLVGGRSPQVLEPQNHRRHAQPPTP